MDKQDLLWSVKFVIFMLRLRLRDDNKVHGGQVQSCCTNAKYNTALTGS